MYYYYRCIYACFEKDLDCVRRIGRDAEKPRDRCTHKRTHNIYNCERVPTNCGVEDRNTHTCLTC